MTVKQTHINRPIHFETREGISMQGTIKAFKKGIVTVDDVYINGIHTRENGHLTVYIDTHTKFFTITNIF